MLKHPTIDLIKELNFSGMAQALEEQLAAIDTYREMDFMARLALLIDRENIERSNTALARRLKNARLRQNACIEDIDYKHPRELDRAVVADLATCQWVDRHQHILITGPTGVGKSYLACAFAHKSCVLGHSVLYMRSSMLFNELAVSKETGRYKNMLASLARVQTLVIDDWGIQKLNEEESRDFLELAEDRNDRRSLIITSQIPVDDWYDSIASPTIADAILDRIVHNAHKVELRGETMRKKNKLKFETGSPKKK